jgi:hypothetical protein
LSLLWRLAFQGHCCHQCMCLSPWSAVLALVALALASPPSAAFAVAGSYPRALPSPVPATSTLVVEEVVLLTTRAVSDVTYLSLRRRPSLSPRGTTYSSLSFGRTPPPLSTPIRSLVERLVAVLPPVPVVVVCAFC